MYSFKCISEIGLQNLPINILGDITNYLNTKEALSMFMTCKRLYFDVKPLIFVTNRPTIITDANANLLPYCSNIIIDAKNLNIILNKYNHTIFSKIKKFKFIRGKCDNYTIPKTMKHLKFIELDNFYDLKAFSYYNDKIITIKMNNFNVSCVDFIKPFTKLQMIYMTLDFENFKSAETLINFFTQVLNYTHKSARVFTQLIYLQLLRANVLKVLLKLRDTCEYRIIINESKNKKL